MTKQQLMKWSEAYHILADVNRRLGDGRQSLANKTKALICSDKAGGLK